ncbi:hypothetical protein NQZ68_023739 [Dissostichus eleginoides]|nr:hypothetical protein NQZ68_023739 [Dissostichus eleginoides]
MSSTSTVLLMNVSNSLVGDEKKGGKCMQLNPIPPPPFEDGTQAHESASSHNITVISYPGQEVYDLKEARATGT